MTTPRVNALILVGLAMLLATFTTFEHVDALGLQYLEQGNQLRRQVAMMTGHAGDPWQYRILTAYLAEYAIRLAIALGASLPVATGFIALRLAIDAALFFLAALYYRTLGLASAQAVLGMMVLAWGISDSSFDSDLQFNSYLDVALYLAAAICLLKGRFMLLPLITLLAALNRETSALMPVLGFALAMSASPDRPRLIRASLIAAFVYVAIFALLRLAYPGQAAVTAYGHRIGLDMLAYNLFRPFTWLQVVATMGVIPLLAIFAWRSWPGELRAMCWAVVPIWLGVHFVAAVIAESRVLLVPQALVFIPGALFALQPTIRESCPAKITA